MEDRSPAQPPSELFVDPTAGSDAALGDRSQPFKTLSYALQQTAPGTFVYLQPGRYDAKQGEQFPLFIPPDVVVVGDVPTRGSEVAIVGGNDWESLIFGKQNAALVMAERSQVRGITVTNPHPKGTGIWIEAATATIAHCTISRCGREGIFVTGEAIPTILNCWLLHNGASGMTLTRYAKGEIQRSLFCQNRFGLTLSDFAAPLIASSEISANQIGIVLSGTSRPVLRENQIVANRGEGLVIFSQAAPDLGDRQSPAGNYFQNNGDLAIRNVGSVAVVSAGNWLHPLAVGGAIEFHALQPVQNGGWRTDNSKPGMPQPIEPAAPEPFALSPDLPTPPDLVHHGSLPFVREILARQIMGCFRDGTFQPDRPVSRVEFAAVMLRAFQSMQSSSPHEAIAQAEQMGLIPREADNAFYPEQPLARWQAIVWLVKGLNLGDGTPNLLRTFRDRVEIPSIAKGAVAAAVADRLLVLPKSNRLFPLMPVTRAEVAVWIYRALVLQGKAETRDTLDSLHLSQSDDRPDVHKGDSVPQPVPQRFRFTASDRSAPLLVAIDLDQGQDSAIEQAGFSVAAQVAERLEQAGVAAKLIQDPNQSIDKSDRLTVIQQIQPALLFQICLTEVSSSEPTSSSEPGAIASEELLRIGIRTQYAPPELQLNAAMLHQTLLRSLDLPDRQLSLLTEPFDLIVPILRVELVLLMNTLNSMGEANSSFCSYLAGAIQQGLVRCLSNPD